MADPTKAIRRRDVLAGLAAGVAGAVVIPGVAAHTREADAPPLQVPAASPTAVDQSAPRLLDDHRLVMLDGTADQILPGARAAGVAALLDRVPAVEPAAARRRFLNALGAFERHVRDRHGKRWAEISSAHQVEMLHAASTLASAPPVPLAWTRGQPVERPAGPDAPPANLRDHVDHVKDWVQRAYLTTAPGMKEFGFTGDLAVEGAPGCTHTGNAHSTAL